MGTTEQTHPPLPEDIFHKLNGNFSVPLLTSSFRFNQTSLVAQMVKDLPAIQDTGEACVQSLDQGDPQEKEISTHTVFLPGKFHRQRSLVGNSPRGHRLQDDSAHTHTVLSEQ